MAAPDMASDMADDPRAAAVWAALGTVTDPELDEPVTELGFVERVEVTERAEVLIDFRLPTYWCAANFAFLMVDDLRRAAEALPWVRRARPRLLDHMYADEVNRGVADGRSFKASFGDLASDEELAEVRTKFRRKAFQRRQEAVLRALRQAGWRRDRLAALTLAGLDLLDIADPEGARQKPRYRASLVERGLAAGPEGPAFVTVDGGPLPQDLAGYLQTLQSVRINMEFNGALCRGLLAARYRELADVEREPELIDFLAGRVPPRRASA
jgi:metal-sulfur cluster biosynthetic enzyme